MTDPVGQDMPRTTMPGSNKYHWIPVLNPSPGERDWQNGDDDTYGFDTMAAPEPQKRADGGFRP